MSTDQPIQGELFPQERKRPKPAIKPLTSKDHQNIVRLFITGQSVDAIMATYGCCRPLVFRVLRKMGVDVPHPCTKLSNDERSAIVAEYQTGVLIKDLATKYRCTQSRVCQLLRATGVKIVNSRYKITTPEQRKEIVAKYLAGRSKASVAADYGATEQVVLDVLIREDVPRRPGGVPSKVPASALPIIQARYPGEGAKILAEEIGCPEKTIRYWAERLKVRSLDSTQRVADTLANKDHGVNHRYFETWSPMMAYSLGYIWADGSVQYPGERGGCSLNLACKSEDEYIIIAIASEIRTRFTIHRAPGHRYEKYTAKPKTTINICSRNLVRSLVNLHGVLPRKTYKNCPFPDVPEEHLASFIRGYFDGDGSVSPRKRHGGISFDLCGTHSFLLGIRQRLVAALGMRPGSLFHVPGVWRIVWSAREDMQRLTRWLYPTKDCFCLLRKRWRMEICLTPTTKQTYRDRSTHGICFNKRSKKWVAYPIHNHKRYALGSYLQQEEAMLAANIAYKKWYGPGAVLNVIPEGSVSLERGQEIARLVEKKLGIL